MANTIFLFLSLLPISASASFQSKVTDNPADELVGAINKNRTASKSSSLYSNPGLACIALQYIKAYNGDCSSVGGPDAKKPSDSEFAESFAPNCGVQASTLSPITGRLLGCQSKYVDPLQAFSGILMKNDKSIGILQSKNHSEVGAAVSSSDGGSPYFWCVLFSNGNSNQSFVLEGGLPKISRPGCFSGANDVCSGGNALDRGGFPVLQVYLTFTLDCIGKDKCILKLVGMKRVNENVKWSNESLGSKKGRFFIGTENSDGVSERTQGGQDMLFNDNNDNGIVDAAETYRTAGFFEDEAADDSGRGIFGGLTLSNEWDFDINFELLFGITEQQNSMGFDLNVPVFGSSVGVIETGVQEFTKERHLRKDNRVEIVEILSDDSDDEVEIVGFNYGYKANGEPKDAGISSYDIVENSNLGLEIDEMECFAGDSGLVAGCVGRYTREEKGKAHMDDSWSALDGDNPILLDLWPKGDFPVDVIESREDFEFIGWQPAASPVVAAALLVRQEEQVSRPRVTKNRVVLNETARRFARINYGTENGGNEFASQDTFPSLKANELLGNMPGPFAEALKLVRQKTSKRRAQDLIEWKPSVGNQGHSITMPIVPSLLDLSLKGLAQNAEGILSLDMVPDFLRRRLTDALCDKNRMSVHILKLLVEGYPTDIRIKNSTWLTDSQFQQIFGNCRTKNLRVLQLDLCGHCMLDIAFRDTFAQSSNCFSRLENVSLRGACRLSDSGLKELLVAAPALRSINLGQCSLLTGDGINIIADYLGSNLRQLYIDDCQKVDALQILPSFRKFRYLEVLSVANIQTVTDQFISEVIEACGPSIKELDLANCLELTDCCLKTIGSSCVDLCSLNISNLLKLTDIGIGYLADGCRSIQKLKLCRNGFSDEVMAAFIQSSGGSLTELLLNNVTKVGLNTALSLAKYSRKLLCLDVSWCRRITNEALGLIADNCSSLKLLKIFGCRQITSVFINGHSNPLVRIIGLNMTPILDSIEPEEESLSF